MKEIKILMVMASVAMLAACGNSGKTAADAADEKAEQTVQRVEKDQDNTVAVASIASQWKEKPISLPKAVASPGIEQLVEAFNATWPTQASQGEKKVDAANGFLSATVEGQHQQACLWKLPNGHRLFAVTLGQPIDPTINVVMFYDYDPATGVLTPAKSEVMELKPSFQGNILEYSLPQKGKDVLVNEFVPGWGKNISHTFRFEGSKHKLAGSKIDDFDKMFSLFLNHEDMYKSENPSFVKYALIDIDQDGNPELWFRSNNEEDGGIYAIKDGQAKLLLSENYHSSITFYKGVVQQSGGCGTGCQLSQYFTLKDSQPGDVVNWFCQYGMGEDEVLEEEFQKNEKPMPKAEGEKFVKSLGEDFDPHPVWHPLLAK